MQNALPNVSLLAIRSLLKATIVLLPLLGLTWVFGLLAVNQNTIIFAWIFTILNSFQVLHRILCRYINSQRTENEDYHAGILYGHS